MRILILFFLLALATECAGAERNNKRKWNQ